MPLARIVARQDSQDSEALKAVYEQLRGAGYEVEIAKPGTKGAADLVVELDEMEASEALDSAIRLAREGQADVFIAPGLFAEPALPPQPERISPPASMPLEPSQRAVIEEANPPDIRSDIEQRGVIGSTLEDLGSALSEGRMGIGDAVSGLRARAVSAWLRWQQQRAEAAQALRLARERREMEREERRRQHEAELQRRAEEHEQLLAERERLAAEQERVLRAQMAREAALRAEQERAEREAMAREAARRAEVARAEEQERRRLAALEANRIRVLREQEAQRAAAVAAERALFERQEAERILRQREEEQVAALAAQAGEPAPPAPAEHPAPLRPAEAYLPEALYADVAPIVRRAALRPTRRFPSRRERQWQRAAVLASIATLAAMLGFALAANLHRGSPIPASVTQNEAQQQIPFGPAKMDISSSAGKAAVPAAAPRDSGAIRDEVALKPVPRAAASKKPSTAKPSAQRRARRVSPESDIIAEDEVIVRRLAARTQPAQTTAQTTKGVRRITDEN